MPSITAAVCCARKLECTNTIQKLPPPPQEEGKMLIIQKREEKLKPEQEDF
jgi:hypothetical protein